MKKIVSALMICIGFILFATNAEVKAEEKVYTVESADFDVFLNEDGSAEVTEKWNVNFKKGDFTRFYISRLKDPTEMEKVSDIKFNYFKINGDKCSITEDMEGRPDGCYSILDDGKKVEYNWYFRANNTQLTLESNYI